MSHNHDHYDGQDPIHHSHQDHGDDHNHDDDTTPALHDQLYSQINFDAIRCLNEATDGSAIQVIKKTWTQRLETEPEIASDCDEQLLLTVPFTGQIRLHSILIRTSTTSSAPRTLHLYINQPELDFSDVSGSTHAIQTIELSQTNEIQDVPVRRVLFNSVAQLTMFFADNWGSFAAAAAADEEAEEVTRITYLAFKGEWMRLSREPVVATYEAAANPTDHKIKGVANMSMGAGLGY